MPRISIKKFSRSKVDDSISSFNDLNPVEEIPKEKKTRAKKQKTVVISEPELEPEPEPELELEPEQQFYSQPEEDNSFLSELNNENYKEEIKEIKTQKSTELKITESEMLINQFASGKKPKQPKQTKQKDIKSIFEDDDSLFDEVGTVCLGRDKRELIVAKINQYKNLFPDELKKFKLKKGASVEELKVYLEEMESIVDCSSVENFLTDSILQCIRIVEGVSSISSKYNIQGCADLLKSNKQFHSLCKQLYIKYKVFSSVPPEWQLLMLVATTAYICKAKNHNKGSIEAYLNQPLNPIN
jgi:hypothetical protein